MINDKNLKASKMQERNVDEKQYFEFQIYRVCKKKRIHLKMA